MNRVCAWRGLCRLAPNGTANDGTDHVTGYCVADCVADAVPLVQSSLDPSFEVPKPYG